MEVGTGQLRWAFYHLGYDHKYVSNEKMIILVLRAIWLQLVQRIFDSGNDRKWRNRIFG